MIEIKQHGNFWQIYIDGEYVGFEDFFEGVQKFIASLTFCEKCGKVMR